MLKSLYKYGEINSYDLLKSIAIVTMIIDHIGLFFFHDIHFLRIIGRISYPIFAFCIGYNQKYNFDIKLFALAIIACLSNIVLLPELEFMIRGSILKTSILPSIIIIRLVMNEIKKISSALFLYSFVFILWCLSPLTDNLFQYGTLGIIIAICGYLCAINKPGYKIFLYLNLFIYFLFEGFIFKANGFELIVIMLEFIIIAQYLKNFTIHKINISHSPAKLLLCLSRYSLIIYFVHSLIFKLLYSLHKSSAINFLY